MTTGHPDPASPAHEQPAEFDRELDQYRLAKQELTARACELEQEMGAHSVEDNLRDDFKRYATERDQVVRQLSTLVDALARYFQDRDRLIAWGPTDDWVVAGSIVTVEYMDGALETFVLTERPFDSEYEVVSYSSPLGKAIRLGKVGKRVELRSGASLVVREVHPGFRGKAAECAATSTMGDIPLPDHLPTGTEPVEWLNQQMCSSQSYRDDLYRRRFDSNVRGINEYVDELRAQRGALIPYVAPTYGGKHAQLLTLLQDPGPKTDLTNQDGSGMICLENADFSAARAKYFLNRAEIEPSEVISWNAYPWPKPHPQTRETDREASLVLLGFLELVPNLSTVVLNGAIAKRIWALAKEIAPDAVSHMKEFRTFHPSPRAIDPAEKSADYIAMVNRDIEQKYRSAARWMHGKSASDASPHA